MVVLVGLNTNRPAGQQSDLSRIKAWWRTLGGDRFAVLPPPTRGRYTQSDGHEDAAEMFATRGIATDTSFAYWHWQSHDAFARSGELTGALYLHWGGDHATVAAGLGDGPPGYRIVDNGPRGAFQLDRVTVVDADGLPDPEDDAGVRQFLARVDEPRHRTARSSEYDPLTAAEDRWLHDRLSGPVDLDAAVRFAAPLEHRQALTPDETARLLPAWREAYAGRLTAWRGWRSVLPALLRQEHPEVWEVAAELGAEAAYALAERPSPRSLELLRAWALTGDDGAVRGWFRTHHALREPDPVRAAAALSEELTAHAAPEAAQTGLLRALREAVTDEPDTRRSPADAFFPLLLATIRFATDDRLPRPLRVAAATAAADTAGRVREAAGRLTDAAEAADALAAVERYETARDDLLAGTGPDLTGYEGGLGDIYHRYRTLSPADVRWLRDRLADPSTGVQGIAFCLELLHAHGEAAEADLVALLPRWKKELTKQYRTTYTEWRHPLVTLTCLAQDLGHPAAEAMLAWWAKPKPLWKEPVRLLTHLGVPTEEKAAELWEFVVSGGHDTGHLMTWVLLRARLDGTHPLHVAEKLIDEPGIRAYVLHRVLIGVADPAQPLWHYAIDPRSHSWWHRAQEVADDERLSAAARAIGLKAAREHYVTRYPDQVRPALTEGEVKTAHAWLEARADRTAAD
ncbi:hypothetical protein LEL86_02810 [Streptomyces sp. WA6-1-16]|uniref:hypothetical protein n=1 Tax=Streptomyces sp. WA6-1-16 TaxID=2879427 RepID=UPI001CE2629F|nr:hypothetical protein [Streptomyces sp. WA6-1-16]UCA48282.1 hypothetical protein LEL86_02810 [Streptomyces sp. WA6-1-16]